MSEGFIFLTVFALMVCGAAIVARFTIYASAPDHVREMLLFVASMFALCVACLMLLLVVSGVR